LPGTLVYGDSSNEAFVKVKALAIRVLADRIEHGETDADIGDIAFVGAWTTTTSGSRHWR